MRRDILDRTLANSLRIINLFRTIEQASVGRYCVLEPPLAQGAQSQADFIAKMSIANKEAHETLYWLTLIEKAALVPTQRLTELIDKTNQIISIVTTIIINTRNNEK